MNDYPRYVFRDGQLTGDHVLVNNAQEESEKSRKGYFRLGGGNVADAGGVDSIVRRLESLGQKVDRRKSRRALEEQLRDLQE